MLKMSNPCLPLIKACVAAMLVTALYSQAGADEPAPQTDSAQREAIRDQRPDASRGWMVVSKDSYWPLCYESLDRIEEARRLIGTDKHEQIADVFEKCGAWLRLAASAAMTEGTAGVSDVAAVFQDAADSLRAGEQEWSKAELNDLTTLGLVLMAKSHLLRAEAPDREYAGQGIVRKSKKPSAIVLAAEQEIAAENVAAAIAQYEYDSIETRRHLTVAQTYLDAAAKSGSVSADSELMSPIPAYDDQEWVTLEEYVDAELRPRVASLTQFTIEQQASLHKKLTGKLE
jgi:hypothetical protein